MHIYFPNVWLDETNSVVHVSTIFCKKQGPSNWRSNLDDLDRDGNTLYNPTEEG